MKVRIKRIDKSLPLPEYKTKGAAAFDLASRISVTIAPKEIIRVPLNVVIEPPEGYMVMLAARSSLHKRGLMLAHSVGIADNDYCGDGDEYIIPLYNFTNEAVTIPRGERIVQGILKKYDKADWEEVAEMGNKTRGGLGSTGLV